MKLRKLMTAVAAMAVMAVPFAQAADLTWDSNGTTMTAPNPRDGTGTWLAANLWWDGAVNATWTAGDNATIGNGGAGGTITLGAVSAGTVLLNNFTGTYTFDGTAGSSTLTQSGGITIGATAGNVTVKNTVVGGAGSITMNSPGLLTLGANPSSTHTFSGDLIINNGVVMVGGTANSNLGSGNVTLNGGVLEFYWTSTLTRTLGGGSGQLKILGGESGFSENGATGGTLTLNNNAASEVVWGSAFFNPSTLVLQSAAAQNGSSLNFQNKIDLNASDRTVAVKATSTATATISGVIRTSTGTAGLTKTGVGTLILSGANTFNGPLTVENGILSIASINNVSVAGVLGNSALSVILGASGQTGKFQYTGGTTSSTKPFTLATGGTGAFDISTAASILTLSGQIDGSGALSKVGAGTLTLTGANSYTGATTVNAGTLTVNSPGSLAAGSAVTVTNATLNGSGTVNGTVAVNSGGTLTGSGTINGTVAVNSGGTLTVSGGTYNGTVTVSGGTLVGSGAVSASVAAISGYIVPGGYGTIGTLTMGSGLTLNGSNGIVCDLGTISGSSDTLTITGDLVLNGTDYVAFNVPTGSAPANATYTVMTWTGSKTGAGSLVFPNGTTAQNGCTLAVNANSVTITTGASGITAGTTDYWRNGTGSYVWDTSSANWTINGVANQRYSMNDDVIFDGTAGTYANPITGNPPAPRSVTVTGSQNYTIAANIGGSGTLTKSGAGTLILTGANTFSGGIFLNAGSIQLTAASTAASLGNSTNGVTFTGSSTLDLQNVDLTFSQSFVVNDGVTATFRGNHGRNVTINGSLTGSGPVKVRGSGNLTCNFNSTNNTVSGDITLGSESGGYVGLISMNSLSDTPGRRVTLGETDRPGVFSYGAGAIAPLTLTNRQFVLAGTTGGGTINNNGPTANTVTINTDLSVTTAGAKTLTLGGSNTGDNTFGGKIVNGSGTISLTKADAGRWILSGNNTFTGPVTINAGILSLSSIDVAANANPLGRSANTAGNLILNGGTLRYTGAAASTDRLFSLQISSSIDASGTGTLAFSNAGAMGFNTGVTAKTLTLTGTGSGSLAAVIGNNTGATSITKSGIGTWTLSGANTLTGTTTLSGGGTLVLDYSTADNAKIGPGALTVGVAAGVGGGTLMMSGGSYTQVVASTTLQNGTGVWIKRTSGSSSLQLNAIGRSNGQNAITLSEDSIASTDQTNSNGILGGWATVSNNWAVNSINGADGPIVGLSSYTTTVPTSGGAAAANYELTGGLTLSGDLTGNSLRLVNGANSDVLALGTRVLTPGTGHSAGILYVGGFDNNYTITGSSGVIKSATPNNTLNINVFTGTLTVNALLNTGTATTVKYGAGTLVVGGNNVGTGIFYVLDGTVRLTHNSAAGAASNTAGAGIVVQNGAAVELVNGITVGTEALTIFGAGISNGGALRNVSGSTATYGGTITIGAGDARINSDSGATLTINNASSIVTALFQDATIGGSGNTTVSGVISGAGRLIKEGDGILTLSGANTYSGETVVNGGTLALGGHNVLNGKPIILNNGALVAGTYTNTFSTLKVSGSSSIAMSSGTVLTFADSRAIQWAGTLNITGAFTAGTTLRFGTSSAGLTPAQIASLTAAGYALSLDANGYLIGRASGTLIQFR